MSTVATRLGSAADLEEYRKHVLAGRDPAMRRVRVCIGTGCTAKGSLKVLERFREAAGELEDQSVAVETKCTGCHGLCELGPIVVVDPGNTFYHGVKEEDVPEIWRESVIGGRAVERLLYEDEATGTLARTPEEIPFYKAQQRIVLALNGVVDPTSIDDYLAAGGYAALAKALDSMTSDEVIAVSYTHLTLPTILLV